MLRDKVPVIRYWIRIAKENVKHGKGISVFKSSDIQQQKDYRKIIIYFDPFEAREESHDADLILITHDHYDHYSPEDIKKVADTDTWIIMPESMRGYGDKVGDIKCKFVHPGGIIEAKGIMINAVPAYNRLKPFHTRGKGLCGLCSGNG